MKFMELSSLLRTNILFAKLKLLNPNQTVEMEAYSCKPTKSERKNKRRLPKPLRFYISALEMSFDDYDFSSYTASSFLATHMDFFKKELCFVLFKAYKNNEDVFEFVNYVTGVLNNVIQTKKCEIVLIDKFERQEEGRTKIFIFYNKKLKRIVMVTLSTKD